MIATLLEPGLDLDQEFEAAYQRGDNVAVVRLGLQRSMDRGIGLQRNTGLPARLVAIDTPARLRELERADDRPLVILNRAVFEKLSDLRPGREDGIWLVGRKEQEGRAMEVHRAMWPSFDQDRGP